MEINLDEFKATWQAYDQKLDSTQQLSQQVLAIVQRNRSTSTIDKMIRELRLPGAILLTLVVFFSAVIAGNPFDYTQWIHYLPAVCYTLIAATGLYFLLHHNSDLRRTTLHTHDLHHALTDLIRLRTRHSALMKCVWLLAMLAGSMIMLPIVARKFAEAGWLYSLLIVLLPIGLTAVSIGLASLAGMFKDRYLDELREQVKELEDFH
ncbi:hypothetical protein [Spirosoma areae]